MVYVLYVCALLGVVYAATMVGLIIQCETQKVFAPARKYVYVVPLVTLILLFAYPIDCIRNGKADRVLPFLKLEGKALLVLGCLANYERIQNRKRAMNKEYVPRRVRFVSGEHSALRSSYSIFAAM